MKLELPYFETGVDSKEQLTKINEELIELYVEVAKEYSKANILAEGFDVIQSTFNLMMQYANEKDIQKALLIHIQKLESRGWKLRKD